MAKKNNDTAVVKLPPPSIDRGEVLRWFANNFGSYSGSNRGLFLSDFVESDETALESTIIELKARNKSPLVVGGVAFYKQAEDLFEQSGLVASFAKPVLSPIEVDLATKELVIVRDLDPPKNQAQLWYFYNHLIYPRSNRGLTTIITTSKGYEEFIALGANLEDRSYCGRPLTWEKAIWLIEANMVNLSLFAMLSDAQLPPMLKDEHYLWMSLSERGLVPTPQYVFEDYLLDLALVLPEKKLDIECGGTSWLDGDTLSAEDKQRYDRLFESGWQVLRFTTAEILNNYNGCAEVVQELWLTGKKRKKPGRLISSAADLSLPLTLPATMVEDVLESAAINHGAGQAALSGAAGTGKTTCIAERVVHLLDQGTDASSILVLSLNSATIAPIQALLKARLDTELFEKLSLCSWRQMGEKILADNAVALKRKAPLKTEANPHKVLQRLLAKHLKELDPAVIDLSKGLDEFTIAGIISLYKARMISAKQAKDEARDKVEEVVAKIYQAYEDQLQRTNKIDENDFVRQAVYLLLDRSDIRVRYQNQFDYVLVDELQDATVAEDMLARIIAAPQDNLFVVGDDDQAILSARGGSRNLLTDISHHAPWTKCYLLAKNWRSDSKIAEKAARILPLLNSRGVQKGLIGWENTEKPAIVGPNKYADEREEIASVVNEIEKLIAQGYKPKDIAVICRQGRYRELVEDSLRRQTIAYVARERQDGLAPNERLDMLSYMRLVADPDGPRAKEDFERICQIRYKDVDPKIASTIASFAEANNLSFMRAVEIYSEATADKSCQELEQLVRVIRNMHQEKLPPGGTIALLKRTQRLSDHYNSIRVSPEVYYEPMSTIGELEIVAKDYNSVAEFLKYLTGTRETVMVDESKGGVAALTVQESKGREFPIVFLVGLSQGSFPGTENCDPQEERRLFYVALTRAQAIVYLSFAETLKDKAQEPSEYLLDMGFFPVEKPEESATVVAPGAVVPRIVAPPAGRSGQPVLLNRQAGREPPPRPKLVDPPKEIEPVKPKETKRPPADERIKIEPVTLKSQPVVAEAAVPVVKPVEIAVDEPPHVQEVIAPEKLELEPETVPMPPVVKAPAIKPPAPVPRVKHTPPPKKEEPVISPEPVKIEPPAVEIAHTLVCPTCTAAVEGDAKFCGECGFPMLLPVPAEAVPYTVVGKESKSESQCPVCSAEIEAGAKFCGECGYKTT